MSDPREQLAAEIAEVRAATEVLDRQIAAVEHKATTDPALRTLLDCRLASDPALRQAYVRWRLRPKSGISPKFQHVAAPLPRLRACGRRGRSRRPGFRRAAAAHAPPGDDGSGGSEPPGHRSWGRRRQLAAGTRP